jgi:ABC-2 type transport system permease protein
VNARAIRALLRAGWITARSYKLSLGLSLASLVLTVVPLYFIAEALQPIAQRSISTETSQYFAFVLVGNVALSFVQASVGALPTSIGSGINSGYFESLLVTPASRGSLLAGLSSYSLVWTTLRATLLLVAGWILGAPIHWSRALPAVAIIALIVLAHWAIGLLAASLVIAFRTTGPLPQAVVLLSVLFGGTYYSTSVIPSWLQSIAAATPLAYGLRSLRRVLLSDTSLMSVAPDIGWLVIFTLALGAVGALAFTWALDYAKRAGSLNTY